MDSFANRLQKVQRHIGKWAKRQGITCYRVYDMDMPEFPFCIDRYEEYLHIAEYKTFHKRTDEEQALWIEACLECISHTLEVPITHIFIKERRRLNRRTEQYEKVATESKIILAQEQGLQFKVNLTDYLDTGLFLDHRPLRHTFRTIASEKRVLNLFAYTGAFSVYAAAGNASHITTVDLSNTYTEWSRENMQLNNLYDPNKQRFIQSDVMDYLKQEQNQQYDLVFVDPPVFSNSKKMKGTWDTQRDHATMLHLILQKVTEGGIVFFSNNLRDFQPQFQQLKAAEITDITANTIPEDFRNKKIHHCYKIIK
jgi:23S rRNA (cytosine1962-C5)-methyltransferase